VTILLLMDFRRGAEVAEGLFALAEAIFTDCVEECVGSCKILSRRCEVVWGPSQRRGRSARK
jgi:hypothetical protein